MSRARPVTQLVELRGSLSEVAQMKSACPVSKLVLLRGLIPCLSAGRR